VNWKKIFLACFLNIVLGLLSDTIKRGVYYEA